MSRTDVKVFIDTEMSEHNAINTWDAMKWIIYDKHAFDISFYNRY